MLLEQILIDIESEIDRKTLCDAILKNINEFANMKESLAHDAMTESVTKFNRPGSPNVRPSSHNISSPTNNQAVAALSEKEKPPSATAVKTKKSGTEPKGQSKKNGAAAAPADAKEAKEAKSATKVKPQTADKSEADKDKEKDKDNKDAGGIPAVSAVQTFSRGKLLIKDILR